MLLVQPPGARSQPADGNVFPGRAGGLPSQHELLEQGRELTLLAGDQPGASVHQPGVVLDVTVRRS